VLRHDKPGCGGSPGDWRDQALDDRAEKSSRRRVPRARALRCGADDIVPVAHSVELLAAALPRLDDGHSGIAVSRARTTGSSSPIRIPRSRVATSSPRGFLPMLEAFLAGLSAGSAL
jgi:hypothetical protein